MKSVLSVEQLRNIGPKYLQHPELVGRTFAGPFDTADRDEVLRVAQKLPDWPTAVHDHNELVEGIGWVLDWLESFPGGGWRDRWVAAGANTDPVSWIQQRHRGDHRTARTVRTIAVTAMHTLVAARVILPDYPYFSACKTYAGFARVIGRQDPSLVQAIRDAADRAQMSPRLQRDAWSVLAKMMLHTGRDLAQLEQEDLFAFRSAQLIQLGHHPGGCRAAWDLLAAVGVLPAESSLQQALRPGKRSVAELVDRYSVTPGPVRDLLVRYLEERKASVDYTTLKSLARTLAGNFWADIERHHPGIRSQPMPLAIPTEAITGWKERLSVVVDADGATRPRSDFLDVLLTVRGFYLDIRDWALEDPSLAPWVVASPITRSDVAGSAKRKQRSRAKIHQRIRERVPLLPELVARLEQELREATELLALAKRTHVGATLTFNGRRYRRVSGTVRAGRGLPPGQSFDVVDVETGTRFSTGRREDDAFWIWALVETLRHTGLRIEELLELTHLALISYRLASTGELVPLLQVVPSKTNEERLLLVTPELTSVLATVISRLRNRYNGTVPLVARYDNYEATTGPRLPHLFQRDFGSGPTVLGPTIIRDTLREVAGRMGFTDRAGKPLHLTPHDFRRIFATTAVQDGLPLHIASRILGHRHLNSTQPYVAVFQDDLIRTYRAFLDKRRSARPPEEYRDPTEAEWEEFEEHFALRRVELGSCARPYGSSCQHEHACIRCPVLRVDPAQLDRLKAIADNLEERIAEATQRGWAGEVQQLQVSLQAARDKLAKTPTGNQSVGPVMLGTPPMPRNPPSAPAQTTAKEDR
ncbi:tyrosine-type recombinase/integrase [Pseudonocardia eucalypti]|uniref:Tyrosine-type recombinase/integrase n=1 Tax=Pseudonocardia eucalypti TaxID=648755 RepID=A0ABP9R5J3_9PSEU|nr:hypothetical protein [Pseudonocardia eucalypti]